MNRSIRLQILQVQQITSSSEATHRPDGKRQEKRGRNNNPEIRLLQTQGAEERTEYKTQFMQYALY
jgi:hypothetical protein